MSIKFLKFINIYFTILGKALAKNFDMIKILPFA